MKYIKYLFICLLVSLKVNAGDWKSYLSYNDPQQIISTEKMIFVMANNDLYAYNKNDHSVETFSKTDILSDVKIKFIAWSKSLKKLIIIYNNGNIDLLDGNNFTIENIPDYFTKNTTDDKTINDYLVKDNIMLLATNFGIVKIDIRKGEIMETYHLGVKIKKVDINEINIFALCVETNTLYIGEISKNLIDNSKWVKTTNNHTFPLQKEYASEEDKAIVGTLKIDGPKNNQISRLKFYDNRLFIASGGHIETITYEKEIPATFQEYSNGQWKYYEDYKSVAPIRYTREVTDIAVDPSNTKRVFVSTYGNGIYEFEDGLQLNNFTNTNTDVIKSATSSSNYVRTAGICMYKPTGDLYFLNLETSSALIKMDNNRNFEHIRHSELFGKYSTYNEERSWANMRCAIIDSRNLMWFVNDNSFTPSLYCFDPINNNVTRYNKFVNQDGTTISDLNYVRCVVEDLEHNIWIGTNQGPLMLTPEMMSSNDNGFIQVKVPRNDGTNYADYLLSGIDITSIAIDPAGRKWMGTNGSGVYLISSDNMEQINHFTSENSSLFENNIRDIAINDKTGEVFFATYNGLCSYIGEATEAFPELNKDNVWAYPNPVTPRYDGDITIVGLSMNSSVTITSSSGHIVASGVSTGGSFKWDGCDKNGKRVASGVYMVHTATSDGKSGIVTKIAVIK